MSRDKLQRFIFDDKSVRGALVQLDASLKVACANQEYNTLQKKLLSEVFASGLLIAANLKFEGRLNVQLQSKTGAVSLVLAQVDHEGRFRGLIHGGEEKTLSGKALCELMPEGQILFSIHQPSMKQPYQAVVNIEADTIAGCVQHYFIRSEQLQTSIYLFFQGDKATGLMLQALPDFEDMSFWDHINILAESLMEEEAINLPPENILLRLFHQEQPRLLDESLVNFACGCSRKKMERAVLLMTHEERANLLKELGYIEAVCDFCNKKHQFNAQDVALLEKTLSGQLH